MNLLEIIQDPYLPDLDRRQAWFDYVGDNCACYDAHCVYIVGPDTWTPGFHVINRPFHEDGYLMRRLEHIHTVKPYERTYFVKPHYKMLEVEDGMWAFEFTILGVQMTFKDWVKQPITYWSVLLEHSKEPIEGAEYVTGFESWKPGDRVTNLPFSKGMHRLVVRKDAQHPCFRVKPIGGVFWTGIYGWAKEFEIIERIES